ncbi:MAG: copper chaperone PCu(A)C [Ilumatobacteraceae bacterium]
MTPVHSTTYRRPVIRLASVLCTLGVLTLAAGCGDDEKAADTTTATTAATAATDAAAGEISFSGQWARTSPMMAGMGAAYVTITSPVDDKLVGGSVDAGIAASVEIHETYMMEPGSDSTMMGSDSTMMGSDTTMMGSDTTVAMGEGQMGMRPVDAIELPAGVAVELKPGGYHIMLIDLAKPLEVGTTLKLTLTFEKAGDITIDVPVLDEAP